MFRTEALKEVGLYSSHYPAAEDYDLFFRMAKRYPVANLEDRVLRYHVNPSGISLQKRRKQLWSRLRILLREFVPQYKESWLGLAKNALLLALPVPLVTRFKRLLKGRRGWL
ncbi:hypothetical protein [Thermus albus]|uniref:hypothetical protein n=1 Tax=Thermus albus TaxID=2908146 RepID=UPI001FA9DA01|nr:hypothetical protein [Thermus albus]